jgi:gas vesicle protein
MRIFRLFIILSLIVLGSLAALIVLLPSLANTEWGKRRIESLANHYIPGTVRIQHLHLSWLQGQKIEGISLSDLDGQPIVSVKEFQTEATLWQILNKRVDLGSTTIQDLNAIIVTDEYGITNLQGALDRRYIFSKNSPLSTISLSNVQAILHLFDTRRAPSLSLKGETEENALDGYFDITLALPPIQINNWEQLEKKAQAILSLEGSQEATLKGVIVNFPVDILDRLIALKKPQSTVEGSSTFLAIYMSVLDFKQELKEFGKDLDIQFKQDIDALFHAIDEKIVELKLSKKELSHFEKLAKKIADAWFKVADKIKNAPVITRFKRKIAEETSSQAHRVEQVFKNTYGKCLVYAFAPFYECLSPSMRKNIGENLKYISSADLEFMQTIRNLEPIEEGMTKEEMIQEILQGAYILIEDEGNIYENWKQELKGSARISSHESDTTQYGVRTPFTKELLFSTRTIEGKKHTWFQMERYPAKAFYHVRHLWSWVIYKLTGKNQGPYGASSYKEKAFDEKGNAKPFGAALRVRLRIKIV